MMQLGCRELGGDCDFVAKGNSGEEIKKKIFAHAEKSHPEMKSMSPEKKKELTAKIDNALKRLKPVGAGR